MNCLNDSEDHSSSRLVGIYDGLRFLFAGYKPDDFPALDEPALIQSHFAELSEPLGFQIPPPEAFVNKIGGALLEAHETDKAVACFKLNAGNYPASAYVYSHLADAYLATGEKSPARQNHQRALELNPNIDSAKKALEQLRL